MLGPRTQHQVSIESSRQYSTPTPPPPSSFFHLHTGPLLERFDIGMAACRSFWKLSSSWPQHAQVQEDVRRRLHQHHPIICLGGTRHM